MEAAIILVWSETDRNNSEEKGVIRTEFLRTLPRFPLKGEQLFQRSHGYSLLVGTEWGQSREMFHVKLNCWKAKKKYLNFLGLGFKVDFIGKS